MNWIKMCLWITTLILKARAGGHLTLVEKILDNHLAEPLSAENRPGTSWPGCGRAERTYRATRGHSERVRAGTELIANELPIPQLEAEAISSGGGRSRVM